MSYQDFIDSKKKTAIKSGIQITESDLNSQLFDYQKLCVVTALVSGKFALFLNTGMGKTICFLEWAYQVTKHTGQPVLILAPLAVARQIANTEAVKFGYQVTLCESQDDVTEGINITNYEKLDKFDCSVFSGVVLDESSILKAYNSKTKTALIEAFQRTPYKLACTATPSPNDYTELGNHSEFLDVMSQSEMLANFFKHDGKLTLTEGGNPYTLKNHGKIKFWEWLASWSIMACKPSDLGFSDDNFILPPLNQYEVVIETGIKREGELFTMEATGLKEQKDAKRLTLNDRVKAVADLVNSNNEQWLVFCDLNIESQALKEAINDGVEVTGSDSDNHKIASALRFASGDIRVLISKPKIFGFGMNFQGCHNIAFVGLSNSFELTYQAVRRCWRFGQNNPVNVYYICVDIEGRVLKNIKRKQAQFEEMQFQITAHTRKLHTAHRKTDYNPEVKMEANQLELTQQIQVLDKHHGKNYDLFQGDCCEVIKAIPDNSIGYSIFSPPFSNLFAYSDSYHDMGNSFSDDEFYRHYGFLTEELYRVIQPGRLVSVHVQDLIATKAHDGYIGVKDLSGHLIRLMEQSGFHYHSRVTIWKDPVCQMQRTKSIGLLHKQVEKDSSLSRQGLPDYLITFRKDGDNLVPISGKLEQYYGSDNLPNEKDPKWHSVNIWQRYASPVWMDIAPNDTLNFREAKDNDDERHLCPLQLSVIRRALQLWSMPGELILSPFTGIGSEGYCSLDMDRKFIGIELKRSYFECAIKNLDYIENKPKQLSLLEAV